jgi:malonyl-CoA O-methyltransferase
MAIQLAPKNQLIRSFTRAAARYETAAVLPREIGHRLLERLDLIRLQPQHIVELGSATGYFSKQLEQRYRKSKITAIDMSLSMLQHAKRRTGWRTRQRFICAEASQLPLADHSIDFIFSNLMLQWCADLNTLFREFRRVLKPEGLLLFTTLGPDTLTELRQSWAAIDNKTHVHAFVDMHDIGDCLVRAKFVDPVVDMEKLTVNYRSVHDLMRDLQALGAHNLAADRHSGLTGKQHLQQMLAVYEHFRSAAGLLPATVEVIYGHAWGPPLSVDSNANSAGDVYIPVSYIQKGNS